MTQTAAAADAVPERSFRFWRFLKSCFRFTVLFFTFSIILLNLRCVLETIYLEFLTV